MFYRRFLSQISAGSSTLWPRLFFFLLFVGYSDSVELTGTATSLVQLGGLINFFNFIQIAVSDAVWQQQVSLIKSPLQDLTTTVAQSCDVNYKTPEPDWQSTRELLPRSVER